MKKILWILATVILSIVYIFLVSIVFFIGGIFVGIITRSGPQPINQTAFNIVGWTGIAIIVISSVVLYRRWQKKCMVCKKWNAMFLEHTDFLKEDDISVLVECEHRSANGNFTGSHDQYIPGKRKTYRDTCKCRFCGNTTTRTYTRDHARI
ncbi:MAG: hypothetical protein PHX08_04455 [Lachnospiraceae bacterium]|nr:hypothetical protein [Lachnospiraceae bacterium]